MKRFYDASSSAALILALGAGAASADVTARQVWTDMQDYMEDFGYEITATEEETGDGLTLTDVTMSFDLPAVPADDDETGDDGTATATGDTGSLTFTMDRISFRNNGDGTVDVVLPETMPLTFDVQPPDEGPVSGKLDYTTSGFDMTISGDPGDLSYDFSADSLGLELTEITAKGKTLGPDQFKAMMRLAGVSGQTEMSTTAELRDIAQSMTAEEFTYDVDVTPPEEPANNFKMAGTMTDMKYDGTYSLPQDVDMAEMGAALDAGFATEGSFSHQGGSTEFTFTEAGQTLTGTSSSESGEGSVTMNDEELAYRVAGKGMAFEATSTEMPFPMSGEMDEALFHIALPLGPAEEAHDFNLALTLGGLSVSEQLWSMIDPSGTLSHEPATVSFDISGTAKPLVDIFDQQQMEAINGDGGLPAELETLKLNDLLVQIAGARLTGEGAFTFDNSDLETFQGMPAPEGEVTLTLDGANQLMDKLVEMGLLPQQQAMSARMMMGMFAVPGSSDDSLRSTIAVTPDGKVLANGQRIR